MSSEVISVTQLNRYVKSILSQDAILSNLTVRGELSNFTRHYKSGHLYFTLKDEEAAIKAVMFRSYAQGLRFQPENGMSVLVTGSVTLYERDGSYQLYVQALQPDGIGALYLGFEQLKEKLQKEGLFAANRKRPLPSYPETIGIVTSEGAAALQDMLQILKRRYPCAKILLYPAQVQGAAAPKALIDGLEALGERQCDVIIIGRGGGSMEDLWAFNDEALARAIAASRIPVVSAVGHETDYTIADFVADLRAPTPSAAAELVTPNRADVLFYLEQLGQRCENAVYGDLQQLETKLRQLKSTMTTPEGVLKNDIQRLEWAAHMIFETVRNRIGSAQAALGFAQESLTKSLLHKMEWETLRLQSASRLVETSSPVRLLEQGFSQTRVNGSTISSVQMVSVGASMTTRVADGEIFSTVTGKESARRKGVDKDGQTD